MLGYTYVAPAHQPPTEAEQRAWRAQYLTDAAGFLERKAAGLLKTAREYREQAERLSPTTAK